MATKLTQIEKILSDAQGILNDAKTQQDQARVIKCEAEEEKAAAFAEAKAIRKKAKFVLLTSISVALSLALAVLLIILVNQPKYKEAIRSYDASATLSEFVLPRIDTSGSIYLIYDSQKKVVNLPSPNDEWLNNAIQSLDAARDINFYTEVERYAAKFLALSNDLRKTGYYDMVLSAGQAYFSLRGEFSAEELEAIRNSMCSTFNYVENYE